MKSCPPMGIAATLLAFLAMSVDARADPQKMVDPIALRDDLRFAIETIRSRHPDLAHSVPNAPLLRVTKKIERQLDRPMDQAAAWSILAQLNPVLADGHLFIGLPNWRTASAEAIRQGTGFFPFEIRLSASGYPVVVAALGGGKTEFAGRIIERIDGRDAGDVVRALLARTHGDTRVFREALLAQRWWLFHSKLYGAPESYDLIFKGKPGEHHEIPSSRTLPDILQRDADFDRLFQCKVEVNGDARLYAGSFAWDDKARFFDFTHDCFARIKALGARRLVIDISANGGGDDDLWKDGILRYIATRPYKHGSRYLKREPTGAVTVGMIESETPPVLDEPLHYSGRVTLLIGASTYSSAVLFSNVVRDYGFGDLAGIGGAARIRQSGGVQNVTLPNSGLILSFPRFVLDPPSGTSMSVYLEPDRARPKKSGSIAGL